MMVDIDNNYAFREKTRRFTKPFKSGAIQGKHHLRLIQRHFWKDVHPGRRDHEFVDLRNKGIVNDGNGFSHVLQQVKQGDFRANAVAIRAYVRGKEKALVALYNLLDFTCVLCYGRACHGKILLKIMASGGNLRNFPLVRRAWGCCGGRIRPNPFYREENRA